MDNMNFAEYLEIVRAEIDKINEATYEFLKKKKGKFTVEELKRLSKAGLWPYPSLINVIKQEVDNGNRLETTDQETTSNQIT